MQEQVLPDLAHRDVCVALEKQLICIGPVFERDRFHLLDFLLLSPRVEQKLVALASSQLVPQVLPSSFSL